MMRRYSTSPFGDAFRRPLALSVTRRQSRRLCVVVSQEGRHGRSKDALAAVFKPVQNIADPYLMYDMTGPCRKGAGKRRVLIPRTKPRKRHLLVHQASVRCRCRGPRARPGSTRGSLLVFSLSFSLVFSFLLGGGELVTLSGGFCCLISCRYSPC